MPFVGIFFPLVGPKPRHPSSAYCLFFSSPPPWWALNPDALRRHIVCFFLRPGITCVDIHRSDAKRVVTGGMDAQAGTLRVLGAEGAGGRV